MRNAWNAFLASHTGATVRSVSIASLVCRDNRTPCDDRLPNGKSVRPDGVHYSLTARRLLAPRIFDAIWNVAGLEPPASR